MRTEAQYSENEMKHGPESSSICVYVSCLSFTSGNKAQETWLKGERIYSGPTVSEVPVHGHCHRPKAQQNIMAVEACGLGGCLFHSSQETVKEEDRGRGPILFDWVPGPIFLPPPYNAISPYFISVAMIKKYSVKSN